MAKTQPKIDDIKDLKKATVISDGLMSKEDKEKLDNLDYGDLGDIPVATDTEVGGIMLGFVSGLDADLLDGKHASDFAQLSNGKILEGNLPDYIFGQVLFGGFIAINTSTNKLVCTLSAKFKSKYNITENTLLLENMPASTYEGVFFMATNSWNTPPNDAQVGDWLISNGSTWSKVDNSDAVTSVNGQIGAVVLTHTDVGAASSNHTHNYGSLTDIPENISMGAFVPSEVNLNNITATGIYPLQYGHKYYSVPNRICGTIAVREDLEGFLIVYLKNDLVSQQLHDTINNILYIRSFDRISEKWNDWKRLLTCVDETNVIIGEEGVYSYTIDRGGTEINVDPKYDPKSDTINIDISSFKDAVPTYIGFNIIFSTPITGGVTVVINNGTSKTINYTQLYQNPSGYTGAMFLIEYRIWNRQTDWLYHNRII